MRPARPVRKGGVARFRLKLLLAMMLVVGGITTGVLYFAGRNAEAANRARLHNEFQGELGRQLGRQELRRSMISEWSRTWARSVRIVAALEEGEGADLYRNAEVALHDVLENDWGSPERGSPHLLRARAFRFLDASGAVVPVSGRGANEIEESWEAQLALNGIPEDQKTGYVVLTGEDGREAINEVIITPIVSPSTGETLGAIALLFTPMHFGASGTDAGIKSGILVKGHLFMDSLSPNDQIFAKTRGAALLGTDDPAGVGTTVLLGGMPYLAFSNIINPDSPFPAARQVCLYPIAESLARRAEQRKKIVSTGLLVLLAALVASYAVSAGLSKPVEQLAEDSAKNVVQRERAEAALEVTERKYQSIFENAIEGIFVLSAEGRFLSVNPALASLFGFVSPPAMFLALRDPDLRLYAEPARFQEFLDEACEHGIVSAFELEMVRADGSRIWVSQNARRVLGEDGAGFHLEGSVEDITERKRAADELQTLNAGLEKALQDLRTTQQQVIQQERLRALGEMASGVAHDFNNALTPILGYSELLLRGGSLDPQTAVDHLKTIHTSATDAASVVSRLRAFYRTSAEGEVFHPIDLNELATQVVTMTQPRWRQQAQSSGVMIEVVTDLADKVPPIAGDASALREMLTNLVFNAVDAMPSGGTIVIRTFHQGDSSVVEVCDEGTGMTEEVRQRCLEPFFSTKGELGTGLGLSMVFGIIQRHGGSLEIRSRLGEGTTFVVSLPVNESIEVCTKAAGDGGDPVAKQVFRVLVVDDEESIRAFLTAVLRGEGHKVQQAGQGLEALKLFGEGSFDLVITDKAMPGMNGDQLATAIKHLSPTTPVILLTGFGQFLDMTTVPDVDFLASKPISIDSLREAIASATRKAA